MRDNPAFWCGYIVSLQMRVGSSVELSPAQKHRLADRKRQCDCDDYCDWCSPESCYPDSYINGRLVEWNKWTTIDIDNGLFTIEADADTCANNWDRDLGDCIGIEKSYSSVDQSNCQKAFRSLKLAENNFIG